MNDTPQNYTELVSQVMEVESITWGDPKRDYIVRFLGTLKTDKLNAREILAAAFTDEKVAAIFQPLVEPADIEPKNQPGRTIILIVSDPIRPIIAQVFDIQETIWPDADQNHFVRYLGALTRDSIEAYDFLEKELFPRELTPLFREEEGRHAVILIKGVNQPRPANPWINLLLFIVTVISVAFVGAWNVYQGDATTELEILREIILNISDGFPFAASLLAILLAHEFGHYIAGRIHKTPVTLPYFLPLPFPPFGTLGAFIQLRGAPKNKRILHDIGIAGPLAGLLVAIPILFYGLHLSEVERLPLLVEAGQGLQMEGNSILYLLAKYITFGEWLPAPTTFGTGGPVLYWLRHFFTGQPFPFGGRDVIIHPIAMAAWGGLLVTALNLIPAGQLDGGHVMYVLLGKRTRRLIPSILFGLFALGFVWSGWWLWAILISVLGRTHAEPLDQITPLDPRRKAIAILGLIIFLLVFTPVPLQLILGPAL